MQGFNKATAAAITSAVTALLVAYTDMPTEAVTAVGVLVTTLLVWLVPNKTKHGGGGGP